MIIYIKQKTKQKMNRETGRGGGLECLGKRRDYESGVNNHSYPIELSEGVVCSN